MRTAYAHLRQIVLAFGARPATREAEAHLRDYLKRHLQERGLTVFEQPFRSIPSLTPPWLAVAGLFVASAAVAWSGSLLLWLVGAAASVLGMAMFWGLVSGRWDPTRFFPQRDSANLIAIAPAQETPRRRVVLIAHLDTQRATLLWHPAQVRAFGRNFQLQAALLAAHTLFALALPLVPSVGPPWLVWLARSVLTAGGLVALYGAAVLFHREWLMPYVQGANDNASGVAVVLSLLEHLAENPLPHTEVWGVFTGCEEVGRPAGAFAFEREYGAQLHDAEFLIVDHVGLGEPRYLVAEAMLPRARPKPEMIVAMEQLARGCPELHLKPSSVPHGAYTDALPFYLKGYRAIALWCEVDPGVPPNWHWITDTLENVSEQDLQRAYEVVRAYLER